MDYRIFYQTLWSFKISDLKYYLFPNFCIIEPLYDEVDSICVGSVVFAGVIGSMAFVALMSSVIVSLLCLKMKRLKDTEASVDNQLNTKDVSKPQSKYLPSLAFLRSFWWYGISVFGPFGQQCQY